MGSINMPYIMRRDLAVNAAFSHVGSSLFWPYWTQYFRSTKKIVYTYIWPPSSNRAKDPLTPAVLNLVGSSWSISFLLLCKVLIDQPKSLAISIQVILLSLRPSNSLRTHFVVAVVDGIIAGAIRASPRPSCMNIPINCIRYRSSL